MTGVLAIWMVNRQSFNGCNKTDNSVVYVSDKCVISVIIFHLFIRFDNGFICYR